MRRFMQGLVDRPEHRILVRCALPGRIAREVGPIGDERGHREGERHEDDEQIAGSVHQWRTTSVPITPASSPISKERTRLRQGNLRTRHWVALSPAAMIESALETRAWAKSNRSFWIAASRWAAKTRASQFWVNSPHASPIRRTLADRVP